MTVKSLSWDMLNTSTKSVKPLYSFCNDRAVFSVQMDFTKIVFGDNGGLIQVNLGESCSEYEGVRF